jgi:hypothetical protein
MKSLLNAATVTFLVAVLGGCGDNGGESGGDASTNMGTGGDGGDASTHVDGSPANGDAMGGGPSDATGGADVGDTGGDAGATTDDGGGSDGPGDGPPSFLDAAGADADWGPATTWVYNLVSPAAFTSVSDAVNGTGDLRTVTTEFYKSFADDYDFIYLFADVASGLGDLSVTVRWDGTTGTGLTAQEDPTFGSAARLKQVMAFGTIAAGMPFEFGPTLHETLHHWAVFLDPSFGFENPHWGYSSANGPLGGFDNSTVICHDNGQKPTGSPPACPLTSAQRMNIRLAPFSDCCVSDIKPYSPIDLYLMGLVPANQVPPLWVMDDPKYVGPVTDDAGSNIIAMDYDIASFHVVTIDDIIAKEGMRPAATQTDFRAAFVMVTANPATSEQMERTARWARRFSGEEYDPYVGVISFPAATGGRATMTTRLHP